MPNTSLHCSLYFVFCFLFSSYSFILLAVCCCCCSEVKPNMCICMTWWKDTPLAYVTYCLRIYDFLNMIHASVIPYFQMSFYFFSDCLPITMKIINGFVFTRNSMHAACIGMPNGKKKKTSCIIAILLDGEKQINAIEWAAHKAEKPTIRNVHSWFSSTCCLGHNHKYITETIIIVWTLENSFSLASLLLMMAEPMQMHAHRAAIKWATAAQFEFSLQQLGNSRKANWISKNSHVDACVRAHLW